MKASSKRTLGIAAALAVAIASASAVSAGAGDAQQGPRGGYMGGPGMMGDPGNWTAAIDNQLRALHKELGITQAQETAWQAYAAAARGRVAVMAAHHLAGPAGMSYQGHFAHMQAGVQQMAAMSKAATQLYEALSPEQRTKADSLLGNRGFH